MSQGRHWYVLRLNNDCRSSLACRSLARMLARSVARSLHGSLARSIARSLDRSDARSLARSIARSLDRSLDGRSIDRSGGILHGQSYGLRTGILCLHWAQVQNAHCCGSCPNAILSCIYRASSLYTTCVHLYARSIRTIYVILASALHCIQS